MKKIITVMLLLVMSGTCYGALSYDVYVRRDVYEVQMSSINEKLDMIIEEQKAQRKDLSDLTRGIGIMSERIDRKIETLSARIDGLDARMGDLRNDIYLGLVVLGIIVGLPTVQRMLQSHVDRKPTLTIEDVKRLIEENNVKMSDQMQA